MQNILSQIRHRQDWIFKILIVLMSIVAIVYILPNETKFKYEFQKGKPWLHEDLIAPFDFAIYKPKEDYDKELKQATTNNRLYFRYNKNILKEKLSQYEIEFNRNWDTTKFNNSVIKGLLDKVSDRDRLLTDKKSYFIFGQTIVSKIYEKGILELHESIENKPTDFYIMVLYDKVVEERQIKDFLTIQTAFNILQNELKGRSNKSSEFFEKLIEPLLAQNVKFDKNMTEKIAAQNLENVSKTYGAIQKDQKIIGQGDLVTDEAFQIIDSMRIEYEKKIGGSNTSLYITLGQFLLVTLFSSLLFIFLILFRKDIFSENSKVGFLFLLTTIFIYLSVISLKSNNINIYILPFCVLPVLIRAFFDVRLAIYTHIITMLIIAGFIAPNSFQFAVIQIIGGISATYSVISIQKRSQIFISSFVIFVTYTLTYLGFSVIQEGSFSSTNWGNIGWLGISAAFTIIAYPLMYAFEKTFSFISDVTLLELSDTNHPLLRDLAEKAPGTFQHSIQVANLAEAAARETGGNALLIRVGALYHDIGKMNNPAFFIENQSGVNPHDELEYERSSQIIVKHVIEGVEMAKKHRLPDEIIDFIRTHHGNSTTGYFYRSYVNEHPNENVDKVRFSYPGPLPFSKETAILMMADACEAASRSLKSYTEDSIKNLVEGIIDYQMNEQQFIHSNITFKDISLIKKLFTKKLVNIYHVRIEYPK